ncbi:MAG: DUF72 domain-containing protein [Cyanobacteria bacterium P01_A01_bin.84]
MKFFIGCAVWAYKDWVGEFYPPGTRASDFLKLYSDRFSTVEGNTTFYAVPKPDTVTRWTQQTSPNFQFCLKLPKSITHQNSLTPNIPEALQFVERMKPLGKKLAPMFAQLPPSYSPKSINDLTTFLEAWQQTKLELSLEVRHQNWFQEPHLSNLTTLLENFNVGKVLLDTRPIYECEDDPQLHSERKKPQLPVQFTTTSPFILIRFISHPNLPNNQPYIEEWANYIKQWLEQGKRIYLFIHCPLEEKSPAIARHFHKTLQEFGAPIPSLPTWEKIDNSPTQLSLW